MDPINPQPTPAIPEPTPAPTPTPVAPQPPVHPHKQPANALTVILQWLTYAFWGWTILALCTLTGSVVASIVADSDTGGFTPYGIAAVLVLLPISFICDHFYAKQEPQKKTGIEAFVMVVHAVIFALCGIGALIVAVIALVNLTVSAEDTDGVIATFLTAIIITLYYVLAFGRTLNPPIFSWIQHYYKFIMLILIGITALLGIIGPVAQERTLKDDKLIENNLTEVSTEISNYTRTNSSLPTDLSQVTGGEKNTQELVKRGIIEYKPGKITERKDSNSIYPEERASYSYELCVTYKKKRGNGSNDSSFRNYGDDLEYNTSPDTYNHPEGNTCYKLQTSPY